MARLPRLTLPGYPHHIIQRGNNRQAIFATAGDRRFLLNLMEEYSREMGVAVHSYVLMDNHFHILATPHSEQALPKMMQAVGRSYVRYFNDSQGRSGTLWEGRYRSALVQAERYLLACMVYIDLNPVRAGMVSDPAEYPWSSFRHCMGQEQAKLVTPHPLFWELGNTPFAREQAYGELITAGIGDDTKQALTEATLRGWALGDRGYLDELAAKSARRAQPKAAGRPRKSTVNLSPIQSAIKL